MGLFHYLWSRTAASNATADSNVNWAEGMAPSAVNDSARSMMASLAGYRDDIAGAITTGGSSTAYTVTSYQVFNSLANMANQVIAFTPHTTNGATVTLNVDGLGAKPLRSAPSVELPAGTLVQGSPYTALYNNSDAVWYLHNFYVSPYLIPLGAGIDYWGATAPNSAFALAQGQAISRTTYSTLFSLIGTTYGSGDGSTTFNIPDKVGRVSVMLDAGSSRISSTYFGGDPATLGAVNNTQSKTLAAANLPSITSTGSNSISVTSNNYIIEQGTSTTSSAAAGGTQIVFPIGAGAAANRVTSTGSNSISVTSTGTTSTPFGVIQPSIICNHIIRII